MQKRATWVMGERKKRCLLPFCFRRLSFFFFSEQMITGPRAMKITRAESPPPINDKLHVSKIKDNKRWKNWFHWIYLVFHHDSSLMAVSFSLPTELFAGSVHTVLLVLCTHSDICVLMTEVQLMKIKPMSKETHVIC